MLKLLCLLKHRWVVTIMPPLSDTFWCNYRRKRYCERCGLQQFSGRAPNVVAWDDNKWRFGGYYFGKIIGGNESRRTRRRAR